MMNKLTIKKKLLLYGFLIQAFILTIFSISLHKSLEISTLDKLENTLRIVILDIEDDILEHDDLADLTFNEEDEYKFDPLYIKFSKINKQLKIIKEINYPKSISNTIDKIDTYKKDVIYFEQKDTFVISSLKFQIKNELYVLEIATDNKNLNDTLENLLYILLFIIPIILILATVGGYFLIYKSFHPIEQIIRNLKEINVKNLSKRLERLENGDEIDSLGKEINNLLQRLEISFDKIYQFSSDASHELKTPLTIIRGEIEIALRKSRSSDEYKETLINCLDEVVIIQQTVNDLLYLAKTEEENSSNHEEIYLDEVILESIKELRPFAKLKEVEIQSNIKDASNMLGNSKLVKIAINNILKNAISFSQKESKVLINSFIKDKLIYIVIEDFGIGISKNDLNKIFEKFYRTDKSRNKNSGGTGLGLSISQKIIHNHKGTISFESEENKGTRVIIKLNHKEYRYKIPSQ
ncbi:MAG: two-component sensor histidine kinase [Arcobacter sp.]|uniref:histidine kinase n=2 Tax=Poseidonibacter ostreae TaxID=2654171 RepID=A0A6L4WMX6_9BACT|nr:HAMP domain-containing protein [Poseidonibacter ostreae]KAB7883119.1 HAMP domain-containing protein [Poseidonibacter ostreae]KAB7886183.1 HAMP domain-containing protein [Poseidonibacter ostreae]MAC83238.1 two-component sensor histidine kinase [Arcobacter sp.]